MISTKNIERELLIESFTGNVESVTELISQGADVNTQTETNTTALMFAASQGHKSVVQALLNNGAERKFIDNEEMTASLYSLENGYEEIYDLI